VENLVTLRIIAKECRNNKTNLMCCFVDFRKYLDTVPRTNLWDRLEEKGYPLFPTLFGIYIDKLEDYLEEVGCVIPTLIGIVMILLLYTNYIVLMVRNPHDLGKQLRIINDFCSNMGMTINTNKKKVMIIKSNKITYHTFIDNKKNLEELPSYKYLKFNIHHKLN
jgi:hypothetical protein